jgi:gamma-glutamyltranspeptidase/glutathione hydrolase
VRTSFVSVLIAVLLLSPSAATRRTVRAFADPDGVIRSQTGVVVSASGIASDLGAAVLSRGGNAVDAAVATAFALAVTYPFAGNLGGGGFMVVRRTNGDAAAFDYRERAPAASTPAMYVGGDGNIDLSLTRAGYLAPGVPGTVAGLALAHKRFGRLPWKDVVLPAAELAARGFPVSAPLARSLNAEIGGGMKPFPASLAAYGKSDGSPWMEGDRLMQPDLAASLRAIAGDGPRAFYAGWIADRIAADMQAHGGLITKADLKAYRARERQPIAGTFLGYEIVSMPPPSSGGVTLIEMLNMLEAAGIEKTPPASAASMHLMVEAMRRAYLDRARFLGDPDFVKIPIERLTSKAHAQDLAGTIDVRRASSSVELGRDIITNPPPAESHDTTHFSVIDKSGMSVANTYTLEGGYGSHVVIAGTGILLNNEMGDFNKKPGLTNLTGDIGTPPNLIAPGKRMLSSMTPTIVTKNGKVVLITGSPGSRTIMNTVLGIVLDVTAWGLTGAEAVKAPRLDHEWLPDRVTIETNGAGDDVVRELKAMGHDVRVEGRQGAAHTIWIDPKTGEAVGIPDDRDPTGKATAGSGGSTGSREPVEPDEP